VRTDTTGLASAPVVLDPGAAANAELLELAPGQYALRFRPDDEQIRTRTLWSFRLASPSWAEAQASHDLAVLIEAPTAVTPCVLDPPVVEALTPPQVSADSSGLVIGIEASDANGPIRGWRLELRDLSGSDRGRGSGLTRGPLAPLPVQPVSLGLPVAEGLVGLRVLASDVDDPLIARANSLAAWPPRGEALIGIGPGCTDDLLPAPAGVPLALGQGALRRHCPGVDDHLLVAQAAGQPLLVRAEPPPGWSPPRIEVRSAGVTICAGERPCRVPPPVAERALSIRLSAEAPTSSLVEAVPLDAACLLGAPTRQLVAASGVAELSLCEGDATWLVVPAEPQGYLDVVAPQATVELEEWRGGRLRARYVDRGGRVVAPLGPGADWLLRGRSANPAHCRVGLVAMDGAAERLLGWQSAPRWLPRQLPLVLPIRPEKETWLAVALNAAEAVELRLSAPGSMSVGATAVPAPFKEPVAGLASAGPVELTLAGEPGQGGGQTVLALLQASGAGTAALGLQGHPRWARARLAGTALPCGPDRLDVLAAGTGSTLLAPSPRVEVVAGLSLCQGEIQRFAIVGAQDALLEMAVLTAVASPPLRLLAPGGQICAGLSSPTVPGSPWEPGARTVAACWQKHSGDVIIEVGPASADLAFDLVWRQDVAPGLAAGKGR
jgi:hypothetical protein